MQTKACSKCLLTKDLSEFYKDKTHSDGKTSHCKVCKDVARSAYTKANPEKTRESSRTAHKKYYSKYQTNRYAWRAENKAKVYFYNLKHRHGITEQDYFQFWANQEGKCPGCMTELTTVKKLCLDHCHVSGRVRGILCHQCNVVLGMAKDNKETLNRLRNYL